jgi:DNA-binding response OmpR family regulator
MNRAVRVLMVDDRDIIRQTLRGILSDFDCDFEEADTGEVALELLASRAFDVVFLDVKLPDISGVDVLGEAKRRGHDISNVIVLTGLPERATERKALELGARKYLTKTPMNREQIRSAFLEIAPPPRMRIMTATPVIAREEVPTPSRLSRSKNQSLPHLLVLDDNEHWLEIMEHILGTDFNLVLTTSPDEAVEHVHREAFDLVILDMKLPTTTGFEVLSQMRKSKPSLRAIILTEHPDLTAANESGRRGALDFVKKDRDTLAATIREILRRATVNIRVFFSYVRADQERVLDYYWHITKLGFLPWIDEINLSAGRWEPQILKAIEGADKFIFFLSRNSSNREGKMRAEINKALRVQEEKLRGSVFIIPVRLEECEIEEDIAEFEVVDLFKPGGFEKLVAALLAH